MIKCFRPWQGNARNSPFARELHSGTSCMLVSACKSTSTPPPGPKIAPVLTVVHQSHTPFTCTLLICRCYRCSQYHLLLLFRKRLTSQPFLSEGIRARTTNLTQIPGFPFFSLGSPSLLSLISSSMWPSATPGLFCPTSISVIPPSLWPYCVSTVYTLLSNHTHRGRGGGSSETRAI